MTSRSPGAPGAARLLALLLPLIAAAPAPESLQDAERTRAASEAAQQAAAARVSEAAAAERQLVARRIAMAAAVQRAEAATLAAAGRIEDLTRQERVAEASVARIVADLAPLLPVIQRLSLYPAETLLAMPLPPEQSVRGIIVVGGIARQVGNQVATLREQQTRVATLRAGLAAELPALQAAEEAQAGLAAQLDAQIGEAQAAKRDADDDASRAERQAAADATHAENVRTAIARLESARAAEAARADARRFAQRTPPQARQRESLARPAPGGLAGRSLTAPVAGTVVRGFGADTDGGSSPGIAYQAAPSARVVAPCSGRAVFAAPFRSFGPLLIVACGGGYHCVLAGFSRLDVRVGTSLQAGEPVGVMLAFDLKASSRRPLLTLELRRDGTPVDPAAFLAARG